QRILRPTTACQEPDLLGDKDLQGQPPQGKQWEAPLDLESKTRERAHGVFSARVALLATFLHDATYQRAVGRVKLRHLRMSPRSPTACKTEPDQAPATYYRVDMPPADGQPCMTLTFILPQTGRPPRLPSRPRPQRPQRLQCQGGGDNGRRLCPQDS